MTTSNEIVQPAVFTRQQAARYIGLEPERVRQMLVSGELKGYRTLVTYGNWRVTRASCDEWIAEQLRLAEANNK